MRRLTHICCWTVVLAAIALSMLGVRSARSSDRTAQAPDAEQPRIVVLSPAIGVICDELGIADAIVGRHAFDETLDPAIPVVGDMNGIDYERLLRLNPTHVLIERNAQKTPDRLLELAQTQGWTLESFPMLALDDIPATTVALASLFRSQETATLSKKWLREYRQAIAPSPDLAARAGKVLPLYWTSPPGAAGPGSFHVEVLEQLGYELAIREGGPYITLDPEDILRMDPDSILLLMPGADPERIEELLGPLSRLDLRCVREGRVGVVRDDLVYLPATSILDTVREIRVVTGGWAPIQPAVAGVDESRQ